MLVTPPVVADCVQQYKTPTPTPALTPNSNPYAPSAADSDKIKDAITILERVARSQSSIADKDSIQRVINQLNMDLMYLKIKNNG